jgi:hypothetical protein
MTKGKGKKKSFDQYAREAHRQRQREDKQRQRQIKNLDRRLRSGGTFNATAFHDEPKPRDPSKNNIYFNGPGDGDLHGHVVTSWDANGDPVYHYARDVEQDVYIDDSKD